MNTLLLGKWGEEKAAEYFRKNKYKVVAVNFRTRFGEIDLIAENKKTLVFVEVKLRKNSNFGEACEFVTKSKQKKIRLTAEFWLMNKDIKKDIRFDVVEIYAPEGISDNFTLNHIEDAF